LAEEVAHALRAAKHTVTVVESTTAGLIQAALQSVAGASVYTTCGAVTYHSSHAVAVLGCDMSAPRASEPHAYVQAKKTLTLKIARRMRAEVDAVWSICEGGACGPSFNVPGIAAGFSVITISGPVERAVLVQSTHANREENMWGFAKAALDLLLLCIKEHEKARYCVHTHTQTHTWQHCDHSAESHTYIQYLQWCDHSAESCYVCVCVCMCVYSVCVCVCVCVCVYTYTALPAAVRQQQ
jgi:nicotinamide mononucleotide (NMN) deamidase PncC